MSERPKPEPHNHKESSGFFPNEETDKWFDNTEVHVPEKTIALELPHAYDFGQGETTLIPPEETIALQNDALGKERVDSGKEPMKDKMQIPSLKPKLSMIETDICTSKDRYKTLKNQLDRQIDTLGIEEIQASIIALRTCFLDWSRHVKRMEKCINNAIDGNPAKLFLIEAEARNANTFKMELKKAQDELDTLWYEKVERPHQEKILEKYWSGDICKPIKQSSAGDCYIIAAMDALKHNQLGREFLPGIISEQVLSDGSMEYYVKLYDRDQSAYTSIKVTEQSLSESEKLKQSLSGAKGDKIIERAMQTLVNHQRDGKEGQTLALQLYNGGWTWRACEMLYGPNIRKQVINKDANSKNFGNKLQTVKDELEKNAQPGVHDYVSMHMFATSEELLEPLVIHDMDEEKPEEMSERFIKKILVKLGFNRKKYFARKEVLLNGHAYIVRGYNKQNDEVIFVNPHNTEREYKATLSEIIPYLTWWSTVQQLSTLPQINEKPTKTRYK